VAGERGRLRLDGVAAANDDESYVTLQHARALVEMSATCSWS